MFSALASADGIKSKKLGCAIEIIGGELAP